MHRAKRRASLSNADRIDNLCPHVGNNAYGHRELERSVAPVDCVPPYLRLQDPQTTAIGQVSPRSPRGKISKTIACLGQPITGVTG